MNISGSKFWRTSCLCVLTCATSKSSVRQIVKLDVYFYFDLK